MLLCGLLVSTLPHDADDRLITGQSPRCDGVVLITWKNVCHVAGSFIFGTKDGIYSFLEILAFGILCIWILIVRNFNGPGMFTAERQLFGSMVGFGILFLE